MSKSIGTVDFHCDVLSKLLRDPLIDYIGGNSASLDVTRERLAEAGAALQVFAIYIPEDMDKGIKPILDSIDLFYRKVAAEAGTRIVRTSADLRTAIRNKQLGAMLSLEGVDGLQGDFTLLRILYYLGVRSLGLTWNYANWAADGVMEPRRGGLTRKGRLLVQECNLLGIILDVSHISEKGFWETLHLTEKPLIASHSNTFSRCGHARNLTDQQIQAIIGQDGLVGITYVPWFVKEEAPATIEDVVRHVEHVCSLGGEKHVMFGSDFDGIDWHVEGLSNPAEIGTLRETLLKYFTEDQVSGFFADNAIRFLTKYLPG